MLDHWFDWRKHQFKDDPLALTPAERRAPAFLAERELLAQRLGELCDALTAEIPTYTPRYIGHMKAELSLPALFGWFAAMLHNPNITSKEASKVGTVIETEAIAMLAEMLGFDPERSTGPFHQRRHAGQFRGRMARALSPRPLAGAGALYRRNHGHDARHLRRRPYGLDALSQIVERTQPQRRHAQAL